MSTFLGDKATIYCNICGFIAQCLEKSTYSTKIFSLVYSHPWMGWWSSF